ncbi:MAG: 3-deoxy-8-phosphooctulonate synthase, partial [Nitrospirae bacterium]
MRAFKIRDINIGSDSNLFLIAGPCVIESEDITIRAAHRLKKIAEDLSIPLIFKSSY